MRNQQELRKKFVEQNKMVFQQKPDDNSDDEKISSTPELRKDGVLPQYFNNLRNLFEAFNKSGTVVTVSKLKNIKNYFFKQADKRAFERNVDDNDKNIFFYLTYVKFDSELVAFFTELCAEANQLRLGSKPLWHELGRYGNHRLTPLEHALARNNVLYAFSIAAQMLLTDDLETLKFVVTRIDRADLAKESVLYIENCKKLNYLILCQLLFNFNKYSFQNKDHIVDCIISLINDGHISIEDSYNLIQQIEASKKDAYSENKSYILPLLHRIARLGNIDPTRCQKILRSITKEKLMELNKETIKENGDTSLLSFAFYINNKNAIEVFKTLLILLDPTVRSESKGSNVFHKLMRNPQLSIIPDILTMMFTSLDSNLLKDLWLSPDNDNYFPLAELIPGRSKTPKKTNSRGELPIPDAQLNTFAETDYSASIPILRRIADAFPEICKIPLGANDETLLMHAIKNKSLQKIIPDIILKSDPDYKNKQGQNAKQIAASFEVQLDEFIEKARTQKDQDYSYYKTREEYEGVCGERDNYKKQRDKYHDELKKSQAELIEVKQEHAELKRRYDQLSTQNETSENDLKRIRQERNGLKRDIEKLNLDIDSKNKKLSQEEKSSKEYKEKLEKSSNDKDKLSKDLKKTQAKLYEVENQHNELKEQLKTSEQHQQSVDLMTVTVKQYQTAAETSAQASAKLTAEVTSLNQQKQQLESANNQLKVTLENRENELKSYKEIQEKLIASNKELDNTQQQNLALQQQLEQLQKQYDELSKKQPSADEVNVATETAPAMQPFSFPLGFNSPIGKASSASIFGQYPSTVFHSSDKNKRKLDDENNSSDEEKDSGKKKSKKNANAEDTNQSVEYDQIIQELLQDPSLENFLTQEPSLELDEEKNCDTNKPKNPQQLSSILQNSKSVPQFFPQNLKFNKENLITVSASAKKPTPVKPVKANSIHPKKARKKLPQQIAYAIGRRGERAAYEILKDYYMQRYDENYPPIDEKKTDKYCITTQETTTGFVLTGFDKTDKLAIILEIIWHNKNMPENEDSGQHHDMQIRRTGGKGNKERYIEIKSTTKNFKSQVKLTAQEWLELIEHKYNFRLYRVFNVRTKPRIEKHKMYEELLQDKLPVSGIKLSL